MYEKIPRPKGTIFKNRAVHRPSQPTKKALCFCEEESLLLPALSPILHEGLAPQSTDTTNRTSTIKQVT